MWAALAGLSELVFKDRKLGQSFCSALGLYLLGPVLEPQLSSWGATSKAPTSHLPVVLDRVNICVSAFSCVM